MKLIILLEKLKNRPFFKNVLTLSVGTGMAHGISFLAQLALLKLYAPDEIGVVARFMAMVSILAIVFTGRYDQAVVLPKDENKGKSLVYISFLINTLLTAVCLLPLLLFPVYFSRVLDLKLLSGWLWLIPITAWFLAGYNILFYWFNRLSKYKAMAASKLYENGSRAGIQIALGVFSAGVFGLMAGRVVGHVFALVYFVRKSKNELLSQVRSVHWSALKTVAKEYIHFPKHLLVSQGISAFYFQMPVLFLGYFFNDDVVGFFATANMFVAIPGILIARAIGDVFRQRAAELYQETGKFNSLVVQTLKHSFLIGLIPFALIICFGPMLFKWYEPAWETTGIYIAILAVSGFFSFVITPVDKAAFVVENTKYIFKWHISRFIFNILICGITMFYELTPIHYLWMLTAVDLIHYFIELKFSYKFSLGKVK